MDFLAAIFSGLVGAAAMTIVASFTPALGLPRLDMAAILGTLVTQPGSRAARFGILLHFLAGIIVAILYVAIWELVFDRVDYVIGAAVGVLHGFVAVVAVPFLLQRHPYPDSLNLEPSPRTTLSIVFGHAVFGVVVALQYGAIV